MRVGLAIAAWFVLSFTAGPLLGRFLQGREHEPDGLSNPDRSSLQHGDVL